MSKYPSRQDRDEIRELLQQFENLKTGKSNSFIEEDSFERIIDYYDEKSNFPVHLRLQNMVYPNTLIRPVCFYVRQIY